MRVGGWWVTIGMTVYRNTVCIFDPPTQPPTPNPDRTKRQELESVTRKLQQSSAQLSRLQAQKEELV